MNAHQFIVKPASDILPGTMCVAFEHEEKAKECTARLTAGTYIWVPFGPDANGVALKPWDGYCFSSRTTASWAVVKVKVPDEKPSDRKASNQTGTTPFATPNNPPDQALRELVILGQPNYLFIPEDSDSAYKLPFYKEALVFAERIKRLCKDKMVITWGPAFDYLTVVVYKDRNRRGFHVVKEGTRFVLVADRFAGEWACGIQMVGRREGWLENALTRFHSGELQDQGKIQSSSGPSESPHSGYVIDLHNFLPSEVPTTAQQQHVNAVKFYELLQNEEGVRWNGTTAFIRSEYGEVTVEEMKKAWSEALRMKVEASEATRKLTLFGPIDDPDYV
jgi:hypothetical protein